MLARPIARGKGMWRLSCVRALGLLVVVAAGSACEQLLGLSLWPSTPDTNVSASDTEGWVQRAARDARGEGLDVSQLAPLLVHVDEGPSFVWFRNYGDDGEQVMAQYEGSIPVAARLVDFYERSPKTVGPSAWEMARVEAAVTADPVVQGVVGPPIAIVGVTIAGCDGPGACAHARLAGSLITAPVDAPGLAPIASVDMTTLRVSLLVPDFPINNP
jgi:hypothetical protein